jgi:uncharacterized protein YlzI (FlbEa/FlbD family)
MAKKDKKVEVVEEPVEEVVEEVIEKPKAVKVYRDADGNRTRVKL